MDDWKTTLLLGFGPFSGAILVLGRVNCGRTSLRFPWWQHLYTASWNQKTSWTLQSERTKKWEQQVKYDKICMCKNECIYIYKYQVTCLIHCRELCGRFPYPTCNKINNNLPKMTAKLRLKPLPFPIGSMYSEYLPVAISPCFLRPWNHLCR